LTLEEIIPLNCYFLAKSQHKGNPFNPRRCERVPVALST
jgi:hypothetical protein